MDWNAIGAVAGVVGVLVTIIFGILAFAGKGDETKQELPVSPASLKVSATFGFLAYEYPRRLSEDQMLFIEAANPTFHLYQIVSVGLQLKGTKKQLAWIDIESVPQIPCALRETETVRAWKPLRFIGQALCQQGMTAPLKMRGFVLDTYDTRHYSDWVDCDPTDWAKG